MNDALWQTDLPGLPAPRRGKVRDVYDLGELLLIVASDRLSAYDFVLHPGIAGKGKILTQLSTWWFERLAAIVPHHLVATDPADFPAALRRFRAQLAGRAVVVKKAAVVPFECVARGYLAGSGFREYQANGRICGLPVAPGLVRASRLPEPLFTPATKATEGHDENVDLATLERALGAPLAHRLAGLTLALYDLGAAHAALSDLILADTKFEFGHIDGQLHLIDEALTPDSSRYWDVAHWQPGEEPVSFDKQYVRNWLDASGWDHQSPPPTLPADVVQGTFDRYLEAFRRLTGREPAL